MMGPSGSGGDGQLIPGGAVGARVAPRPAACCALAAAAASASVNGTAILIAGNPFIFPNALMLEQFAEGRNGPQQCRSVNEAGRHSLAA
jgi:hypothetical protein